MTAFRVSQHIDFNTGYVMCPPMLLIDRLGPRANQTDVEMLLVFECRVDVWQLGPAVEILKVMEATPGQTSVWAHSAYTLLGAVFSYFEMIGKILNPASAARGTSGVDFNFGFLDVYPSFAVPDVIQFRNRVRNGIYHLGYTKSHLYIHNDPAQYPEDFVIAPKNGEPYYFVNPHALTRTVVDHFPTLMTRLRDTGNPAFDGLRKQFKAFYLDFHDGTP